MKQLIFVAVLLGVHWTQAQTNFESGFIINNEGDTIRGEINFNWVTKPDQLTFRALDSDEKQFITADLKGFKIENGDFFQSLTIDVDISPTKPNELLEMGKDKFEEQSFFAKVLLLGTANLYQSFDQERARYHYFIENGQSSGPIELISGKRSVSTEQTSRQPNAAGAFKELDKYKGQLAYLLGDCPEVQKSIRAMSQLTENSARTIIEKYNGCGANVSTYKQEKSARRKTTASLGILLGGQSMDANFELEGVLPEDLDTPADIVHNVGAELKLDFSNRKKFGMSVLLFHRSFRTSETFFEDRPIVDGFSTFDHSFDELVFITKANINFGVGENQFFLSFGPGIGFTSGALGIKRFETSNIVNLIAQDSDRQFLLNFGTGYQWKKFRASVDYELGGSMPQIRVSRSGSASFRLTYFFF